MSIDKNNVSAQAQTKKKNRIEIIDNGGKYNVLFLGNSITRHSPKSEIGWENDWGMAASAKEKDYVHITVKLLEERLGKINYGIINCSSWESNYYKDEILDDFAEVNAFQADIIVFRLGENLWSAKEYFSSHPLASYYAKMVAYFAFNPAAKCIITTLFWKSEMIDKAIEEAARKKGCPLVHLGDLGDNKENTANGKFWHAGVDMHPGDLGMQRIAERIASAILQEFDT